MRCISIVTQNSFLSADDAGVSAVESDGKSQVVPSFGEDSVGV
jgi:hypothetical protein